MSREICPNVSKCQKLRILLLKVFIQGLVKPNGVDTYYSSSSEDSFGKKELMVQGGIRADLRIPNGIHCVGFDSFSL